jgi:predicted adenine nucleotide alpha hydrolase (AANH) superfamily ATPase
MQKLLLSACCGPCSTVALERLYGEYDITVLFYGSNLDTADEYEKRLNALKTVNTALNGSRPMIIIPYEHLDLAMRDEPEGGRRCAKCFEMRLQKTAEIAVRDGFDLFATTLTTSPHKDAEVINKTGETVARRYNLRYLATHLRENGGFARSIELSKQLGIYRQKYCGCRKM